MPDDARTVPVTLDIDGGVAPALDNEVGAHRRGLTDESLDAELEAYNAERRERPPIA